MSHAEEEGGEERELEIPDHTPALGVSPQTSTTDSLHPLLRCQSESVPIEVGRR